MQRLLTAEGKNERCHKHFSSQQKVKTKGVTESLDSEKLSTTLCDTFQKCTLYACKMLYYPIVFCQGVTAFVTPCDTFVTPFDSNKECFPALKNLQREVSVTPFKMKTYRPALHHGLRDIDSAKGVTETIVLVLKGVIQGVTLLCDTLNGQGVLPWQF